MSLVLERASTMRPAPVAGFLKPLLPVVIALVLAYGLFRIAPEKFGAYPTRVMLDVGVAIILSVSLNIVNGFTGQFSMGHGGFLAVGGYVAAAITYYGSLIAWGDAAKQGGFLGVGEWMLVGGCIAGGFAAAGAGYLVGLPSLRLRGDYLAIVTLGFGEIVRVILELSNAQLFDAAELREATWRQFVPPPLGGAQGFSDIPKYTNLFWVYVFVALTLLFSFRMKQSSTGRALLSIREDEIAAQAMGVNITKLKVRAFVFAAYFAGVAGGLYAHQSGTILRPLDAGFQRSFDVIIMVVLGGMGSISGATLAAILLTVAGEWLRDPTHVWYLAIYVSLIRIAFTPRESWRDIVVIAAAAVVIETARAMVGEWDLASVGDVQLQAYEVAYAVVMIRLFIVRRDVRRGVIAVCGFVAVFEVLRAIARHYEVNLGGYRMIFYALLLVLMMIFRPQGLFGVREAWDYLPHRRHAAKGAA